MKIALGSDHAGFEAPEPFYKPALIAHLQAAGHDVIDCGPEGPGSVDYPDFADKVCREILEGRAEMGVLLCGTGMGISIRANRHRGIRATVCNTEEMAQLAREHNNANILCLGKRISSLEDCLRLMDVFFDTDFSGGERHVRRIGKIDA